MNSFIPKIYQYRTHYYFHKQNTFSFRKEWSQLEASEAQLLEARQQMVAETEQLLYAHKVR